MVYIKTDNRKLLHHKKVCGGKSVVYLACFFSPLLPLRTLGVSMATLRRGRVGQETDQAFKKKIHCHVGNEIAAI